MVKEILHGGVGLWKARYTFLFEGKQQSVERVVEGVMVY